MNTTTTQTKAEKLAAAKEYRKTYYAENKKSLLVYMKKWQAQNKEKLAVYRKEYYKKHHYKLNLVAERHSLQRTLVNAGKKIVTVKARLEAIERQLTRKPNPEKGKPVVAKTTSPKVSKPKTPEPIAPVVPIVPQVETVVQELVTA